MFVEVESVERDNHGEVTEPVLINIDNIQYIVKCQEEGCEDQCMIQFAGGFPIFVRGTLFELGVRFNML